MAMFTCVVMGSESLAVQCSERLLARGHKIQAVVTARPDVAKWAASQDIAVIAPGDGLAKRLDRFAFDWLFSIANLALIPQDVLALPRLGAINFHDGPLPRHAGLNAPVWAMIEGERTHGVAWHLIETGVDTGAVMARAGFDIDPGDTALTLNTKAYEAGLTSFTSLLATLERGDMHPEPQDATQRSYHALGDRPSAGGILDLSQTANKLERLVRALDHGPYWNPLCVAKLPLSSGLIAVRAATLYDTQAVPGTVLQVSPRALVVACGDGGLTLTGLTCLDGAPLRAGDLPKPGDILDLPTPDQIQLWHDTVTTTARHDGWWRQRLSQMTPLQIGATGDASGDIQTLTLAKTDAARVMAWAAHLARDHGSDIALTDPELTNLAATGLIAPWVPLAPRLDGTLALLAERIAVARTTLQTRAGFAADLPLRDPALTKTVPQIALSFGAGVVPGAAITVDLMADQTLLHHDTAQVSPLFAPLLAARLEALTTLPDDTLISDLPTLSQAERDLLVEGWNATDVPLTGPATMAQAFEAQVAASPEAPALVFEGQTLTYADVNAQSNRVAHTLRDMGVVPDTIVGLFCRRGPDLLIGALGILKAGGAYLPLDPAYPADRLRHYVADSETPVIVTQTSLADGLPPHSAQVLALDDAAIHEEPSDNPEPVAGSDDLAYVIYTSGSTGTPKGVMVEHRNALNFYAGMDRVVPHEPPGTWLAVTSLSFDISVLELFWTTARGFKVVLTSDEDRGMVANGPVPKAQGQMDFSLYYWGNDDGVGRDKYRLLLEGAKFADTHGFCAVWTPERHFHAFGGPYPNPSVTGAAVAAVTRNIAVRAGSVVSPLHHPARIAEEWAVIDNLTNGRAGLALASGWQPDDFVLRPENTPPDNKAALARNIDQLRRLWSGEAVDFPRADGTQHAVVTQPRPVSDNLPLWITTAGNPETWREAGRTGCNVLTHLLGQSVDEVADKIRLYHAELRAAGYDPGNFTVTLMLHTCVAATRDQARQLAREPMKSYLRSAAALIKQYAWAFPAFKRPAGVSNAFDLDLGELDESELDAVLDFAFERYFNESGLFGTVEDAVARTEQLKRIGVGEIACLIDYGIATDQVLAGLKPLAQVVQQANQDIALAEDDFSIAAQIVRHGVTHLQCTPSMARMIVASDEARGALSRLAHVFLGGEALPGPLVAELQTLSSAKVTNMYGPTETTVWSSSAVARSDQATANIGLPLANQQMYVLDDARDLCPVGVPGELWIGGAGVTRGYLHQPGLTTDRFLDNPFHPGRMYRTGDMVVRRADGVLDYIGRIDGQVKLRGHRMELGEVEAALAAQPEIVQAVAVVREDVPGDKRLVAYVTAHRQVTEDELRAALVKTLPYHMIPQRFVRLDDMPLTPNLKIDRKALPEPAAPLPVAKSAPPAATVTAGPGRASAEVTAGVTQIWQDVLGTAPASGQDNFFDLGGHSLLAVQAHRALRDRFGVVRLTITDVFRFPTLDGLAGRIAQLTASGDAAGGAGPKPGSPPPDRALSRSEAMARRRAMRARKSA